MKQLVVVRMEDGRKIIFCTEDKAIIGTGGKLGHLRQTDSVNAAIAHIRKKWHGKLDGKVISVQTWPLDDFPFAISC